MTYSKQTSPSGCQWCACPALCNRRRKNRSRACRRLVPRHLLDHLLKVPHEPGSLEVSREGHPVDLVEILGERSIEPLGEDFGPHQPSLRSSGVDLQCGTELAAPLPRSTRDLRGVSQVVAEVLLKKFLLQ